MASSCASVPVMSSSLKVGVELEKQELNPSLIAFHCQAYNFVPRIVGNGSSGDQKGQINVCIVL